MLFQEPHLDYVRFSFRSLNLPAGVFANRSGTAGADQHANEQTSSFSFHKRSPHGTDTQHYFLAVSSDVGELGGSVSLDNADDVAQVNLDFDWIDPNRVFLDHTGRCVCLYHMNEPPDTTPAAADNGSLIPFFVEDGAYVHTVCHLSPGGAAMAPLQTSGVETTTMRDAAERSIVLRIVRVVCSISDQTNQTSAKRSVGEQMTKGKALERARLFLKMPQHHPYAQQHEDGVQLISNTILDVYSLLNRQLDSISNASTVVKSNEEEKFSMLTATTGGVSVLAEAHPLLAKLFLLEESTPEILRAGGANAMASPIVQELVVSHAQDLRCTTNHLPAVSPRRMPAASNTLPQASSSHSVFSVDPLRRQTSGGIVPGNIPKMKSLLSQPEMTVLKTPWSEEFTESLKRAGFSTDDPDMPPVARVHLSRTSAEVARNKVQSFLEAKIKVTNACVKKAQEMMMSGALQTSHGYWSREQRNFMMQIGFADDVMRVPCSKKPHIPSVLRVAAQSFLDDFIAKCSKPFDERYASQQQATMAGDLRMLAEEQIAEYEFIDSLLYAPNSPIKTAVWPVLPCEFLRLIDFPAFSSHAPNKPFQELEGVSPSLRQEVSDFLRQRNQLCPMESAEDTIHRRCLELLSSSYLTTACDIWPEDLRHFLTMLDFLPREMKNTRSVVQRDVRDLAKSFLELRAQGKDPKLEIARGLVNHPAFRLTHRPLMHEHILQIYLIGFPCQEFDNGVDALINFQPNSSTKSEMHRFLNEYIRVHSDDRLQKRLQRFKELLYSPYLCNDHVYWPKEIRMIFADENYFRQDLSLPIHQMLSVPPFIRRAARYFVEGWLRDRLASLLSSFPNALVPSFPALSTLPDGNDHLAGNDDSAQAQWSMVDKAAYQKDTMREDTVGHEALLMLSAMDGSNQLMTPPGHVNNGESGAAQQPTSCAAKSPSQRGNDNQTGAPGDFAALACTAYLQMSVFRVDGAVAAPVDDFAPMHPSMHKSSPARRGGRDNTSGTPSNPSMQPHQQQRVDLHAYLASSNFAQGQLESHSIRPVVSIAVVHSDKPDSLVLSASAQGFSLVDHTWAVVNPQVLSSNRGGLGGIMWTPVVMGSSTHASAVGLETNVHVGVFQKRELDIASSHIQGAFQQHVEQPPQAHVEEQRTLEQSVLQQQAQPSQSTPFGAPVNHAATNHQSSTSRFGDPYGPTGTTHHQRERDNLSSFSLSPVPHAVPRPRPATGASPSYLRPGVSSVRNRLATSTRTSPFTSSSSRAPPGAYRSTVDTLTATRPLIPRTPTRPNTQPSSFSDCLDITPPPRHAGKPFIFSPIAQDISDTEALQMIKTAESNAGISSNFGDSTKNSSSNTLQERTRMEWDRRRQENLSRARAQASVPDEFAPVSIPSNNTSARASVVGGVSLSNVGGRRPDAAAALTFDMRSNTQASSTQQGSASVTSRRGGVALTFDDLPVGGQRNTSAPSFSSVGHQQAQNPRRDPWNEPSNILKEEIDTDEAPRTPSFSRRRFRDTLSLSPPTAAGPPAFARRRVEATQGLERYASNSSASATSSFTRMRNAFDDEPLFPMPQRSANRATCEPPSAAHPWEDQPAVAASQKSVEWTPSAGPAGRPPRSTTAGTTSAAAAPSTAKMTTSEKLAAAKARREELKRQGAPTQDNTDAVVVAVPQRPNPFKKHEEMPIRAPPSSISSRAYDTSNPFQKLEEKPVGISARENPPFSSVRGPAAAARLPPRNPFGSLVDSNVSGTQAAVARRVSERNPFASTGLYGQSDEEAMRQIREIQAQEEQRTKAGEEAERKRRQDQLVQERLRRNFSGPSATTQRQNHQGEASSSSLRAVVPSFAPRVPHAIPSSENAVEHRVLCEASFSLRSLVVVLMAARVDLRILHDNDCAVSAVLQSAGLEHIRVFVVPPNPKCPHEVQPCAIAMIPLQAKENIAAGGESGVFSLAVRIHNVEDFVRIAKGQPVMTLPLLQDLEQQKKKRWVDGGRLVGWRNRIALFARVHRLWRPMSSSDADCLRVTDSLCDPFVTEARSQHLAIKFQLFNHRRRRAMNRIRRQGDQQNHLRSLGLRSSNAVNLFVSPLETLGEDSSQWPLHPVVRRSRDSAFFVAHGDVALHPADLSPFHVHRLLGRQRAWLDSQNPLVCLRLRKQVINDLNSATVNGTTYFQEIEKLLRSITLGANASRVAHSGLLRIGTTLRVYVGRAILFIVWVIIQQYTSCIFPLLVLLLTLCIGWVHLKSLWGSGVQHRVELGTAAATIREQLSSSPNTVEHYSHLQREQRVALLTAFAFLAQKARRFLRGDSIVFSAIFLWLLVPLCILFWWCWIALTNTDDRTLTERDSYLGLRRHIELDYSTSTVTTVEEPSQEDRLGLATLEFHFYTGYLMLAPYAINPMKWVCWAAYRYFVRDPTLGPLHA